MPFLSDCCMPERLTECHSNWLTFYTGHYLELNSDQCYIFSGLRSIAVVSKWDVSRSTAIGCLNVCCEQILQFAYVQFCVITLACNCAIEANGWEYVVCPKECHLTTWCCVRICGVSKGMSSHYLMLCENMWCVQRNVISLSDAVSLEPFCTSSLCNVFRLFCSYPTYVTLFCYRLVRHPRHEARELWKSTGSQTSAGIWWVVQVHISRTIRLVSTCTYVSTYYYALCGSKRW
jgi:hypothetical protein